MPKLAGPEGIVIPSHDRFNAVLGTIKPGEFEKCVPRWIAALHEITDCLEVKNNQPTLCAGIEKHFDEHLENDFANTPLHRFETQEKGHGRAHHRLYDICPVPDGLPDAARWKNLKAIGIAVSKTHRGSKNCCEVRSYSSQ